MEGQGRGKEKTIAGLLAILLGSFGAHHFYLGSTTAGIILLGAFLGASALSFVCIGLFLIWIPGTIGLIEGIMLLIMPDDEFNRRYNARAPGPTEFVFMKPKA